jgi:uncharacterized membrane protein (UPF0182 family)
VTPPAGNASASDIAKARQLYDKAIAAQRSGDWQAYGDYIDQLGTLLKKIAPSAPATSTK